MSQTLLVLIFTEEELSFYTDKTIDTNPLPDFQAFKLSALLLSISWNLVANLALRDACFFCTL